MPIKQLSLFNRHSVCASLFFNPRCYFLTNKYSPLNKIHNHIKFIRLCKLQNSSLYFKFYSFYLPTHAAIKLQLPKQNHGYSSLLLDRVPKEYPSFSTSHRNIRQTRLKPYRILFARTAKRVANNCQ